MTKALWRNGFDVSGFAPCRARATIQGAAGMIGSGVCGRELVPGVRCDLRITTREPRCSRGHHAPPLPEWYAGSLWETDGILTPGAALAWHRSLSDLPRSVDPFAPGGLVGWLPERFRARYDVVFVRRFIAVLQSVYRHLVSGELSPGPPFDQIRTPAEEIALRILEEAARATAEWRSPAGLPWTGLDDVESAQRLRVDLVGDLDVDLLWGHEAEGIEQDPVIVELAGWDGSYRFEHWFEPRHRGR